MAKLTDRIERWASRPFQPGEGLHSDIFVAVMMMLEAGHVTDDIFRFVRKAADVVTERIVPDREIHSAIAYAVERLGKGPQGPRWPDYIPEYRAEIISRAEITIEELSKWNAACVQESHYYISQLYSATDFVCVGASQSVFSTLPRDEMIEACRYEQFEYINPSPMIDRFGLTKEGKVSAHCLDNTAPKAFQVIEFDFGAAHEHAAILWYLARTMPLFLIVYSGGKSLHGWFNVRGASELAVVEFFNEAVRLGADPRMWSRCQFSRLPAGRNNKTLNHQSVVLFNPNNLGHQSS